MKITNTQLQTLCAIAEQAGSEVMAVYDDDVVFWEKRDASPLTDADLRADAVIRTAIEATFPSTYILSEESSSNLNHNQDTPFFLVDPLDGTKEFLKHNGEFTVNIALIYMGRAIAGVVYAPALQELFFAAQGLGAWKRDARGISVPINTNRRNPESIRVIGSRSHGGDALEAWLSKLPVNYTFVPVGSSLKFCRIAEGKADIYPRLGPTSQWDTAAAQCILETAGGAVHCLDGKPLTYGLNKTTLNPHFIAAGDIVWLDFFESLQKAASTDHDL